MKDHDFVLQDSYYVIFYVSFVSNIVIVCYMIFISGHFMCHFVLGIIIVRILYYEMVLTYHFTSYVGTHFYGR